MVRRGEITDRAWHQIEPLLPEYGQSGGQWRDWCEPIFPDSTHSQLPAFRACSASNSTGGRYPNISRVFAHKVKGGCPHAHAG